MAGGAVARAGRVWRMARRGWTSVWSTWRRGQADLQEVVRSDEPPAPEIPGPAAATRRRRELVALVVLAVVPSAVKSVAIATGHWKDGYAYVLAVVAVVTTIAVLRGADTTRRRAEAFGLRPLPSTPDRATAIRWTVGPALASLVLAAAGSARLGLSPSAVPNLAVLVLVTAPAEELLFRSALLPLAHAVLDPRRAPAAVAASFGAWHIGNALAGSTDASTPVRLGSVIGTVAFTATGGYVFNWLRFRSGTLAGSVLGHVATNLPGSIWG